MSRRIRWIGVVAGAGMTILLVQLDIASVSLVVTPTLHGILTTGMGAGVPLLPEKESGWNVYEVLSRIIPLTVVPLAFLVGSFIAGRVAPEFPELTGIVSATVVVTIVFVWLLPAAFPGVFVPPGLEVVGEPGEAYTPVELILGSAAFCVVAATMSLIGYLGGRLGGYLRPGN